MVLPIRQCIHTKHTQLVVRNMRNQKVMQKASSMAYMSHGSGMINAKKGNEIMVRNYHFLISCQLIGGHCKGFWKEDGKSYNAR